MAGMDDVQVKEGVEEETVEPLLDRIPGELANHQLRPLRRGDVDTIRAPSRIFDHAANLPLVDLVRIARVARHLDHAQVGVPCPHLEQAGENVEEISV